MTILAKPNGKYRVAFPFTELSLLLVAIFWGTSYGLTKEALLYTPVLLFIVIRFSLTGLCLLPIAVRDINQGLSKDWKVAIPTGGILSAIFFFEVYGVLQTTASNAAFLISLSVILTSFAEFFINGKRISNRMILLTLLSVVGVFLLTQSGSIGFTLNTGDYFILIAAVLRAIMVTATKRLTIGKVISNTTLTCLQSMVVALSALLAACFTVDLSAFTLPTEYGFWLIVIYLVMFCTLFAFYVQNYAVRKISPTRASLLMGSEPLFGALFAMLWLGESLSVVQLFGGMVILACVILASVKAD
ncbi:DMT family transporter [Parasalinivibrio latis]|uniref:DMT family transporter n=1 Tax=Parasalinivibrio latis TaxID=2952610 RepID=UPI0030E406E6